MKNITIITSTRAEYGLLRSVIQKGCGGTGPAITAGCYRGTSLCPVWQYGAGNLRLTACPLRSACRFLKKRTPNEPVALTIARTITVFDGYFAAHRPDAVLLLGRPL